MPPTLRYFRDHLRGRLLNARSWFDVAFEENSRVRSMLIERVIGQLFTDRQPSYPTWSYPKLRSQLEQICQTSVSRSVKFLLVLTGGGHQTYAEQLLERFQMWIFRVCFD